MKTTTYIVSSTGFVVGLVNNLGSIDLGDGFSVTASSDLEGMTLQQLTNIYISASGKHISKFSCSKVKAIVKVMVALESMDISKMILLDPPVEVKAEIQIIAATITPTVRKIRDTKLQRMAAAFREQDDTGSHKLFTIKKLMEQCRTSEPVTKQYISVLRAASDRFVMNIVKDKDTRTYQYQPKPTKCEEVALSV